MEKLKQLFLERWNLLSPEEKRKVVLILVIILVLVISLLGYYISRGGKSTGSTANDTRTSLTPLESTSSLERARYMQLQAQLESFRKELEDLKKLREEEKKMEEERLAKEKEMEKEKEKEKEKEAKTREKEKIPAVPPPPPPVPPASLSSTSQPPSVPPAGASQEISMTPAARYIGDIKIEKISSAPAGASVTGIKASGEQKEISAKEEKELKKEQTGGKKKVVYLPPSFMEATLLSGLDAPAVSKEGSHPVPVLMRVTTPAVLPNEVKANLKGCFVIAEGIGNLASERADMRVVSLSCLDKKGRAVIDQPVSGFVVDSDGKIGLRGRVVSKMGSAIVRSLLAGFFSGFGSSLYSQSFSLSTSPLGGVFTTRPEKSIEQGLGLGIQRAMDEIAKFYLNLAQQTIPVIEILPTRKITVVISRGVELHIREFDF